jgi:uncharacterized Zn-binding protein involved in type VI secretion
MRDNRIWLNSLPVYCNAQKQNHSNIKIDGVVIARSGRVTMFSVLIIGKIIKIINSFFTC